MLTNMKWACVLSCALASACASEGQGDEAADSDSETDASGTGETGEPLATYTYWRDAKAVIDRKCVGCHAPGNIGPFSLETYAEVAAVAAILPPSIADGSMPPWPASDACRDYAHARSLDADERELLLTWLDEGAVEGDAADAPAPEPNPTPFEPELTLSLPEPYTPQLEPDDYRCFVIPWNEAGYVTGVRVDPDQRSIVHHVIAFAVDPGMVDMVEALDAEDPEPGYTCFGGSGVPSRWVGSWAPGGLGVVYPEGTGVRMDAGSRLVVQMHYNTSASSSVADQSAISFMVEPTVERPLVNQPLANPGWVAGFEPMTIPAGDPDVSHETTIDLSSNLWAAQIAEAGVAPGEDILLHVAGLHMHTLGVSAKLSLIRAGGADECVVEIPRWDFHWQGGYELDEPLRIHPGDQLHLSCTWDNSAANQPIVEGERLEPIDVAWGEGTRDEMCLGVVALTRVQ
jgi:hypothetical protein